MPKDTVTLTISRECAQKLYDNTRPLVVKSSGIKSGNSSPHTQELYKELRRALYGYDHTSH